MSWQERTAMLSPKEERAFWLAELKRRLPYGMAVNCKHMPSLDRTPVLRKLIEDGLILRIRQPAGWGTSLHRRTILRLPE